MSTRRKKGIRPIRYFPHLVMVPTILTSAIMAPYHGKRTYLMWKHWSDLKEAWKHLKAVDLLYSKIDKTKSVLEQIPLVEKAKQAETAYERALSKLPKAIRNEKFIRTLPTRRWALPLITTAGTFGLGLTPFYIRAILKARRYRRHKR